MYDHRGSSMAVAGAKSEPKHLRGRPTSYRLIQFAFEDQDEARSEDAVWSAEYPTFEEAKLAAIEGQMEWLSAWLESVELAFDEPEAEKVPERDRLLAELRGNYLSAIHQILSVLSYPGAPVVIDASAHDSQVIEAVPA